MNIPNKGIHYRVRIGPFSNRSLALNLCVDLSAEIEDCFAVEVDLATAEE